MMVKKVVILVVLVVSALSRYWEDWNQPFYTSSYPIEASVNIYNTVRVKSNPLNSLAKISSQYSWINTIFGFSCRISCAPRSFLTIDPATNLAVCKRDKSQPGKFWNAVLNPSGQLYADYCIPKLALENTTNRIACNQISADLFTNQCSNTFQPLSYIGKGYDCCYSSSNITPLSS